jgi:hypothetical protein
MLSGLFAFFVGEHSSHESRVLGKVGRHSNACFY